MTVQSRLEGLSPQDLANLKRAATIALSRNSLIDYATLVNRGYEQADHLKLLCTLLEQVEQGDVRKACIILPPRSGKSWTTTGTFPSWCLGRDPTRTVMITSYAATLAEVFSVQNRDTIAENPNYPLVFPNITLSQKTRGKDKWAIAGQRESCIAAGVGGPLTGLGAWLLLIDDPVKNYEEAISAARQEANWLWYTTTARTRLTADGRIVIIGTRWVEGDLIDRVLNSEDGKEFEVLHLPALSYGVSADYERDYPVVEDRTKALAALPKHAYPDKLNRSKGKALWPTKFNETFLHKQQVLLGNDFQGLYQGHPSAPAGTKFKTSWFRAITPAIISNLKLTPKGHFTSYDLAWSESERADYTAGLKASLYKVEDSDYSTIIDEMVRSYLELVKLPPVILVLERVTRFKKEWDDASSAIINQAIDDGPKYELLVEGIASQSVGFKSLKRDKRLWKHTIHGVTKHSDKEISAKLSLRLGGLGCFFILYTNATTPPAWEFDFLKELGTFPNAKNDDQVDALSQLVNYLQPTIDAILQSSRGGVWQTLFIGPPPQGLSTNLPPEFRETNRWVGKKMGW